MTDPLDQGGRRARIAEARDVLDEAINAQVATAVSESLGAVEGRDPDLNAIRALLDRREAAIDALLAAVSGEEKEQNDQSRSDQSGNIERLTNAAATEAVSDELGRNTEQAVCGLCGKPMPEGEEMFSYHGYSGPCPK